MRLRRGKRIALAVAVMALATVVSVESVWAKKNSVIGTVNGKRIKWKGRYVVAGFSGAGTIIVAAKPGRVLRVIGFGCPIYPPDQTFPLTPPAEYCNANYTETKGRLHPVIKGWLALKDVQVTYESFDGSRLTGRFAAVLDPVTGNDAGPVTVEGTFSTKVSPGE